MLNFRSRRARLIKKAVVSAVTAAAIMVGTVASAGILKPALADDEYTADIRDTVEKGKLSGKTVVLHTGDVNGAVDGYAKLSALKDDLESAGAEVVMADAGNYTQTGDAENAFRTIDGLMLMTSMGYTVATAGDAEFSGGYEPFRNDISGAKFRLILANVYKDDKSVLTPSYLYKAGSGLKIGFLGLSDPGKVDGLSVLSGNEMYDCAATEIDSLKKSGADLIIGLTHIGIMDAEKLYQNVKGIDFIIDGNANVAATQGAEGEPVQTVGERFAYIGALVIDKEGNINDHYLISTDKLDSDAALQEITDRIKERLGSSVDIASGDEIAKIIEEYAEEADDSSDAAVSEDKSADNNSKAENTVSNEDSGDKDSEANADAEIKDNSDIVSADENNSDAAAVKEVSETDVETTDTEGSEDAALSVGSDGKYEVVKGDCLWKIAEKHLGDGSRWGEIYELNSDIISNPSLIYVGQQLVLPPG